MKTAQQLSHHLECWQKGEIEMPTFHQLKELADTLLHQEQLEYARRIAIASDLKDISSLLNLQVKI